LLLLLLRLGRAPSTVWGENEVSHNGGAVKGQRGKGKGKRLRLLLLLLLLLAAG